MRSGTDRIADALERIAQHTYSPNELDSNMEAANVVDGLFAIARAIRLLAKAIETKREDTDALP
jgi:hypothetical protein